MEHYVGERERVWDTASVAPAEQFAYWRDLVCETFVPLSPERIQSGAFAGRLAASQRGPMVVAQITAQAVTARRTTPLIARRAGDVVFLNLQTRSHGIACQGGRTARQEPGDLAIVDSTRPFELAFNDTWAQLCVSLPAESLESRVIAWQALTAVTLPAESCITGLLGAEMRCLAQTELALDREAARHLSYHLVDLLSLALGRAPSRPKLSHRTLLVQAAVDEIDRRLSDPLLAPGDIARHLNISTRYLHDLFTDLGETVRQCLLHRRLERSRRDLADPTLSHLTLEDISHRHGFNDRTYFSRAYCARFGVTPSLDRRNLLKAVDHPRL